MTSCLDAFGVYGRHIKCDRRKSTTVRPGITNQQNKLLFYLLLIRYTWPYYGGVGQLFSVSFYDHGSEGVVSPVIS